ARRAPATPGRRGSTGRACPRHRPSRCPVDLSQDRPADRSADGLTGRSARCGPGNPLAVAVPSRLQARLLLLAIGLGTGFPAGGVVVLRRGLSVLLRLLVLAVRLLGLAI